MRTLMFAAAVLSIAASPAIAAPCKDAKGKFMKCPDKAAATTGGVTKDKNGKCRVASGTKKGQFTKC